MKILPISLIIFGIVIIVFPQLLTILLGGFFIFIGLNMFFINKLIYKNKKGESESYVKFGNYKIFR